MMVRQPRLSLAFEQAVIEFGFSEAGAAVRLWGEGGGGGERPRNGQENVINPCFGPSLFFYFFVLNNFLSYRVNLDFTSILGRPPIGWCVGTDVTICLLF